MDSEMKTGDLTKEEWREYEWGTANGRTTYRIIAPKTLYHRVGGSTHRILDTNGIVHLVPAPGQQGCVLRWKPKNPDEPVQF